MNPQISAPAHDKDADQPKTVTSTDNDQCVYRHLRNDTGTVFYIGRGVPSRPYEWGRNLHWDNIANKHGRTVEILAEGLSLEQANEMEIALIAEIGRVKLGTGPLVNATDGGEGMSGYTHTEETREKMSANNSMNSPLVRAKVSGAARKNWKNPEYAAKISEARRKQWADPEQRAKRSEAAHKQWSDPEARAKKSKAARKQWKDPEKLAARRKWNTPDTPMAGIVVDVTKTKGTRYRPRLRHNGRDIYPDGQKSFYNLEDARSARRALELEHWGVNPNATS